MWISQQMWERQKESGHTLGKVTGQASDGILVQSDTTYQKLPMAAPYGITAVPPAGEVAVVLTAGGDGQSDFCAGIQMPAWTIQPGELLLQSAGGASIYLKNTGEVVINGTVYGGGG